MSGRVPPTPIIWHDEVLEPLEVETRIRKSVLEKINELRGGAECFDTLGGARVKLHIGVHLEFTWVGVELPPE